MGALEEFQRLLDSMKARVTRAYFRRREEEYLQRIEELKVDIGRNSRLEGALLAVTEGRDDARAIVREALVDFKP